MATENAHPYYVDEMKVKCPHCRKLDYAYSVFGRAVGEGSHCVTCECGNSFEVEVNIIREYTSRFSLKHESV